MGIKVVALDIDGVLNCEQGMPYTTAAGEEIDWPFNMIEQDKVDRLNRLTDETGAVIVLSSTWRIGRVGREFREKMKSRWGLKAEVIDFTDNLWHPPGSVERRVLEIQKWLADNSHLGVEAFVSIDDMNLGLSVRNVHCSWRYGFSEDLYPEALLWLNTPYVQAT